MALSSGQVTNYAAGRPQTCGTCSSLQSSPFSKTAVRECENAASRLKTNAVCKDEEHEEEKRWKREEEGKEEEKMRKRRERRRRRRVSFSKGRKKTLTVEGTLVLIKSFLNAFLVFADIARRATSFDVIRLKISRESGVPAAGGRGRTIDKNVKQP